MRLVMLVMIGMALALYAIHEQAVDTLIQCICEDLERNDGRLRS